jgi:hypothetical protein
MFVCTSIVVSIQLSISTAIGPSVVNVTGSLYQLSICLNKGYVWAIYYEYDWRSPGVSINSLIKKECKEQGLWEGRVSADTSVRGQETQEGARESPKSPKTLAINVLFWLFIISKPVN